MKNAWALSIAMALCVGVGSTSAATVVGARSIRITSANADTTDGYIQIGEVIALTFANLNVALAANGGVATASDQYRPETGPGNANDGVMPYARAYPEIYHSLNPSGSYLDITFAAPVTLSSLAIYGRTDAQPQRDIYNVAILDVAGGLIFSGQVNARNGDHVGTATFDAPTAGVPEPATWAMFIGGCAAAGAMLRRRQVAAV